MGFCTAMKCHKVTTFDIPSVADLVVVANDRSNWILIVAGTNHGTRYAKKYKRLYNNNNNNNNKHSLNKTTTAGHGGGCRSFLY